MKNKKMYFISADNGNSWTYQWLTKEEAEREMNYHIVVDDKEFYDDLLMEQQEQM